MTRDQEHLENLIRAAEACRVAASANLMFECWQGLALLDAIHAMTGCDDVLRLRENIAFENGLTDDPVEEDDKFWRVAS